MSEQKIIVPNIGDFKEVEVIEVLIKEGQKIKKNDSVITIESDKSSVEVPSDFSGIIKKINIKVGDKVSEGTIILSLDREDDIEGTTILSLDGEDDIEENNKSVVEKNNNKSEIINFPKNNIRKDAQLSLVSTERNTKLASPIIRKFTRELGADISKIPGSERSGRVTREDVKNYVKGRLIDSTNTTIQKKINTKNEYEHSEFGEIEIKDIPRIKKMSGPHLVKSWTEIPHVTQHEEIDITEMDQFRSSLRDLHTGQKISVTPLAFIMRAMVNALKAYPNFNASIDSENGK